MPEQVIAPGLTGWEKATSLCSQVVRGITAPPLRKARSTWQGGYSGPRCIPRDEDRAFKSGHCLPIVEESFGRRARSEHMHGSDLRVVRRTLHSNPRELFGQTRSGRWVRFVVIRETAGPEHQMEEPQTSRAALRRASMGPRIARNRNVPMLKARLPI